MQQQAIIATETDTYKIFLVKKKVCKTGTMVGEVFYRLSISD
jgi:hypothetical protein